VVVNRGVIMDGKFEESMRMLFSAKWNIPQAALHCGMTWGDCMVAFKEYCKENPPTHDKFGSLIDKDLGNGGKS